MSSLRTLTVDDEPLALERVSSLVQEAHDLDLIGQARNGLEALDLIAKLDPDLIFIDVEMPELSGFGVVAALDSEHVPGIVFVTAFDRYAVNAFEVGAIDYLQKPVTKQRFTTAVERAKQRFDKRSAQDGRAIVAAATEAERSRGKRARFVVTRANAHHFVPASDVDWIDVADNYLRLHIGSQVCLWRGTMKQAEEELDPAHFVRIHRSAIVAVDRIRSIQSRAAGGHIIELQGGERLRTSRRYADRVKKLIR